ncbi:hypothetical protein DVH24_027321 [Malus domestica]|uniref:Uncharacterized protein n=1 Tax=Malus domestica TaxID=3750 RepID=A0A498IR89_MALDO|nr:hypothetical protein DVH24_027321 [Malus domestica]
MARFSSSSSRSSSHYSGARSTYSASSGKRSPSAYDEVAVRYPNRVSTLSLFCEPDWEFRLYKRILSEDCGIEVDVSSSKKD